VQRLALTLTAITVCHFHPLPAGAKTDTSRREDQLVTAGDLGKSQMKDTMLAGVYEAMVQAGDLPEAYNDIGHPDRVVPVRTMLTFTRGVVDVPPHSLTIVNGGAEIIANRKTMMSKVIIQRAMIGVVLVTGMMPVRAAPAKVDAPTGVLRKPIPDKVVALTFDDGPASSYTVVAPILKSLGFGGSFYICDFDSFRTRKDWYLTWRQMIAMAADGFEIGNHTTGHAGGSSISGFLSMEDDLVANGVPKPTTIAWPVFAVNTGTYPELTKNGYTFGRGGHFRPYRPTVDNPFDIPCLGAGTLEEFVKSVRQAAGGRIVTLCYHGVPDIEHAACSLDPAVFKAQMQYLKDNHYQVIALRDLAEYIDPAKAAKLPPTVNDFKDPSPPVLATEEKPAVVPVISQPAVKPSNEIKPPAPKAKQEIAAVKPLNANQPNVFTWNKGEVGNWSEGAKWSNNLTSGATPLAAGQADYVFDFDKPGNYSVANDLQEDFVVNQLNFKGPSVKIDGKSLAFTANGAANPPRITQTLPGAATIAVPIKLAGDLTVDVTVRNGQVILPSLVSGTGRLIKNGEGLLRLDNAKNTFSGGTTINRGGLCMYVANEGLGTGPITLNDDAALGLEHVNGTNPLILNGGTIHAGNGFGDSWSGPITLNGNTNLTSYADFVLSAAMSGPGGFTHIGGLGAFGPSNSGTITLTGTNTYTGPTIARRGVLRILKAASLYHADPMNWTPAKIAVHPCATLVLSVGGPDEFSGAHIGTLLKNLTDKTNDNGLMERAVLCLNTTNAKESVVISTGIADSKGLGGGAFLFKKCGAGILQLTGTNTYTGQTILEAGMLSVASLNSYIKGKPSSSLGAPTDIETGEIVIGSGDGECGLIYTGGGETTDRVMNLAGKNSTVTFNQSGKGLWKLTSTFVLSGHSANKLIALKGDTAGSGEIAGNLVNPHDRAGKATTAVAKSGTGTWTLSGTNSYTGPTTVTAGTLVLASARSLGGNTDVTVSNGATLALNFKGEMRVGKLIVDGKPQPAGSYSAASSPGFIKGTGVLNTQ
jgi:autotransporter-associated beta strand protein